jgi:hypothetical protein
MTTSSVAAHCHNGTKSQISTRLIPTITILRRTKPTTQIIQQTDKPRRSPEVQSSEGKPPAHDQLRASRYALLKRLQETLYDVQDKNASVQAGWKALWGAFVHSMQSNRYLREWHNGDAVARLWIALGRDGREKFVNEYFGIDLVAMARWEKEHASSIVEDPKYRETQ